MNGCSTVVCTYCPMPSHTCNHLTCATADAEAVPPKEEAFAWPLAWAFPWSSLRSAGLGRKECYVRRVEVG